MFLIGQRSGDLTNTQGGIEELVTGRGDAGSHQILAWSGPEILSKSSFEATDGHSGLAGEGFHVDVFTEVFVDLVDQTGDGAVRSGERGALTMFESTGNAGGSHDLVIFTKKRDFGCHPPFNASSGAGDEFELVVERGGRADDFLVIAAKELGHGGREKGGVGFSDEIFRGPLQELGVGSIGKDDFARLILDPEHDVGQSLEETQSNLAGLEAGREIIEAGLGHEV